MRRSLPSLLVTVFILLNGCGGKNEVVESEPENNPDSTTDPGPNATNLVYYMNTMNNEKLAEISNEGEQIIVSLNAYNLFGALKRADKRKYFNQNDELKYTVKYKEDGFKLNDKNETLLWKVKLYDDHIKISNNEEMTNSYRIGRSESNKIKLKKGDDEIAALRIKSGDAFLNVQEKYSLRNFGSSLALGVLLINDMPEEEKVMLCAELLKKGK